MTNDTASAHDETNLRHLFATALYDSDNTGRLQEHPEELERYLQRAGVLLHHMRALGIDVTILEEKR